MISHTPCAVRPYGDLGPSRRFVMFIVPILRFGFAPQDYFLLTEPGDQGSVLIRGAGFPHHPVQFGAVVVCMVLRGEGQYRADHTNREPGGSKTAKFVQKHLRSFLLEQSM